ncbi:hypothetical protein BREVNS_0208 [Brevinematales bacterium NS]|nr:hypothetical protein BREVNS_0208 [Brevinematales bacterium NS]
MRKILFVSKDISFFQMKCCYFFLFQWLVRYFFEQRREQKEVLK